MQECEKQARTITPLPQIANDDILNIVGFLARIIAKVAANMAALWIAATFVAGFSIAGGMPSLVIGGIFLAAINLIVRPILKLLSLPFLVLTLGAFYVIIFIILLLIADFFMPQLEIAGFSALLWASLIIGVVNTVVK